MQIIDAQIHIWSQGLPSNAAHIQTTSYQAPEAIAAMDEAGVAGAVIHPPPWDPTGAELAEAAVLRYPGRFAIMGSPDLSLPNAKETIETWRDRPGRLGIRYTFLGAEERAHLEGGGLDWLWPVAEKANVPIAALATDSFAYFADVAERHPGLRITIDHFGGRGGNTTLKDHEAMTHMPELLALAKHPNIGVKATGAPGYSAEAYPFPIMQDYVCQVFEAFGPTRTFWGTDITKMPCSWRECIEMFTDGLDWLKGDDQRLVMGDAILDWWGWKRDA